MQKNSVAIVGAGVSGLATAKSFLSQGHAVTVFEKLDTLGGVWSPARRYPGLRIQISRKCYCLSDFPMPDHYPEFPTSEQMHAYLEALTEHRRAHLWRNHIFAFGHKIKGRAKTVSNSQLHQPLNARQTFRAFHVVR